MGTNYRQRLKQQGRWEPGKYREEREERELKALLRAWFDAGEPARAEFMGRVGIWEECMHKPEQAPEADVGDLLKHVEAELTALGLAGDQDAPR